MLPAADCTSADPKLGGPHRAIVGDPSGEASGSRPFKATPVAFIDKGEQEGITPGQLFWIFKQEQYQINPDDKSEVTLTPVILGELLVLHTEQTTATVMITDSRNAIHSGALIASPFKLE